MYRMENLNKIFIKPREAYLWHLHRQEGGGAHESAHYPSFGLLLRAFLNI